MRFDRLLPAALCRVRPVGPEDDERLVAWIELGRREGVFRRGPPLDVASLRSYQDGIRRSGAEYACLVVEAEGRPVGYLDYRYQQRRAELLGLYLESPARGGRLGRHLLRWAGADLRERGCRTLR